VKEYLEPKREESRTAAVRRFETPPGRQAQVDWAHLGTLAIDGEEYRLSGFTFTLGYSRMMMAEAALDQKLGTLLRMHEEAFRQLGGVREEILYDRMKTAIRHKANCCLRGGRRSCRVRCFASLQKDPCEMKRVSVHPCVRGERLGGRLVAQT
jgi:transposase